MSTTPALGVSRLLIATNVMEFLLTVGQTVMVMGREGDQVTSIPDIQWISTISLSPVTAKQLHDGLTIALSNYIAKFGPIPADPDFKSSAVEVRSLN